MAIPKHDDIRIPALQLLAEHNLLTLKEFETPLANIFGLTEAERMQKYASGNSKVFYDRISWALSYMNMAGLLEKPKRGTYQISPIGKSQLKTPNKLNAFIENKMKERSAAKKAETPSIISETNGLTPQETLYESFTKIQLSTYNDIIDVILNKSPREFEKLVVLLLQKMGYGGEVKASGEVTQASNDKGIDGIIKEDVLGLGRIYIQAKRYARANTVGREEVQKFVGALATAQSNKGVFITTSSYTKNAIEYADSLNGTPTLILIDGNQMAEYIYQYNLGMQTEQTFEIKKLDSDFWDAIEDAN